MLNGNEIVLVVPVTSLGAPAAVSEQTTTQAIANLGSGGGGSPGGTPGQVQYNNAGVFGGLTNTQLTANINDFTSSLSGAVPASGGGTTNFLRADGTFAAPSGGGSGITRSISSVSTNTTAGAAASTDYVYFCSGGITLTLPTAVGNNNQYTVINTDGSSITVTSSSLLNGSSSIVMNINNQSIDFISNTSNWQIK